MYCNCDNQHSELKLYNRENINHTRFDAFSENNLCYHNTTQINNTSPDFSQQYPTQPTIHRLDKVAKHKLWHQRLIHPGQKYIIAIHTCRRNRQALNRNFSIDALHACRVNQKTE